MRSLPRCRGLLRTANANGPKNLAALALFAQSPGQSNPPAPSRVMLPGSVFGGLFHCPPCQRSAVRLGRRIVRFERIPIGTVGSAPQCSRSSLRNWPRICVLESSRKGVVAVSWAGEQESDNTLMRHESMQEIAWRIVTKGIARREALPLENIEGELGA